VRLVAVFFTLVAASGFTFVPSSAARARSGTADLQMIAARGGDATPVVAGESFSIFLSVFNNGPDPSSFTIHVQVPEGVTFRAGSGCTGTTDLTCFPGHPAPVGDDGGAALFFQAAAGGMYKFVARLTDEGATDPNSANNEAFVTVPVGEAPHALAVVGFHIAPTHPRAGGTFSVSFRVHDKTDGTELAPTAARCRASLGHARARVSGARAICVVATPRSARGKLVRGLLTVTARGRSLSRHFAVYLR
jgi:hypothetical protein